MKILKKCLAQKNVVRVIGSGWAYKDLLTLLLMVTEVVLAFITAVLPDGVLFSKRHFDTTDDAAEMRFAFETKKNDRRRKTFLQCFGWIPISRIAKTADLCDTGALRRVCLHGIPAFSLI